MARDADILQFHAPFPLGDLGGLLSGYKGKIALYWHSDVVKQKRLMHLHYRSVRRQILRMNQDQSEINLLFHRLHRRAPSRRNVP